MALEIERKFLVKDESWQKAVTSKVHLRDGLIERAGNAKVRVRVAEGKATLALKTHRIEGVRSEYEYPIPLADAENILATMCDHVLEKIRYCVDHQGFRWIVDVYEGLLFGIVIAEIELSNIQQTFPLPEWVGQEVTNNPSYQKINLVLSRKARSSY